MDKAVELDPLTTDVELVILIQNIKARITRTKDNNMMMQISTITKTTL